MESHSHVFLGEGHEHAEKRIWWVIDLCGAMMVLEIAGGLLFGSFDGDRRTDLHVRRLGPGHLAAVLSIATGHNRRPEDYHQGLRHFPALSHITAEVHLT